MLPLILILIIQVVFSLILHVRCINKADYMEKLGLDVLNGENILSPTVVFKEIAIIKIRKNIAIHHQKIIWQVF